MNNQRRNTIYGVQLFDDLHNYLPALLYHPEQFNSIRECLEYIQNRARNNFNLYDIHQRNFTIDSDSNSEISEIEERYNRRERIIRENERTNQSSEELLQNLLNDFISPRLTSSNPITNILSMFTAAAPLNVPITSGAQPSIQANRQQINNATQLISTTISSEICSICHESLANSEVRRINHCRHMFHQSCIDRWFQQNARCPVCRYNIL